MDFLANFVTWAIAAFVSGWFSLARCQTATGRAIGGGDAEA